MRLRHYDMGTWETLGVFLDGIAAGDKMFHHATLCAEFFDQGGVLGNDFVGAVQEFVELVDVDVHLFTVRDGEFKD